MDTTAALNLSEPSEDYGLLRRAGRAVLGGAAILIVGAGGIPAAQSSAAGVATGLKHISSQRAGHPAGTSPTALPTQSRAAAARFVVDEDGRLTPVDG